MGEAGRSGDMGNVVPNKTTGLNAVGPRRSVLSLN